jgi:hypothetical protein
VNSTFASDTHTGSFQRDPPYYRRALLHLQDGKLIANFSRRCLVGHSITGPRTPGIPGLTEAQAEALDALHAVGRRHELKTSMETGDIRFVNNMGLMHRRDAYEDDDNDDDESSRTTPTGLDQRRHLMRLWLHNPRECWTLPPSLRLAWERIYGDFERSERWDLPAVDADGRLCSLPIWEGNRDDGEWPLPDALLGPESPDPVTMCD